MCDAIRKVDIGAWIRSSRCVQGNCVELQYAEDHRLVRDSKADGAAWLTFGPDAWSTFLERYHSVSS
jgi:uncharacterized protein DUF397